MLKWVFGADTSPFRSALNSMRSETNAFAGSVKGQLAGMFGIGAIVTWVKATADAADRIGKLSKRLDMSAESLQRLDHAADLSGANIEILGKGLTILTKNLNEARNGSKSFDDAASALGLNLSEMTKMSPEKKIMELARGYEASSDKGAALASIMTLLGKSGGELVPLIADGPKALAEMMDSARVATDSEIRSIEALNDAMTNLKQGSIAALGSMVSGLKTWAAYIEFGLNKLSGNGLADGQLEKRMDAIMHPESKPGADMEKIKEAAETAKKIEEERKKLTESIAKLEEDARIRSLDLAEKILDAEKRRAVLAAESIFGQDETKALEARKSQLEVEKEIAGYREKQAADDKKTADDKQKAIEKNAEDLVKLAERSVELDRSNKLAGMSDREKREFLKSERSQAMKDSADASARGDSKGSLESSNKAKQLTGEINDITRSLNDDLRKKLEDAQKSVPTISTSSLTDIGGGGGARLMDNDQSRRMVDLLAQIAANTAGGAEGSKPPEPI